MRSKDEGRRQVLAALFVLGSMMLGCQPPSNISVSQDDAGSSLGVSQQELVTTNSGAAYITQCQAAGVPVPMQVTNSLGWVNHGMLPQTMIARNLDAELLELDFHLTCWGVRGTAAHQS